MAEKKISDLEAVVTPADTDEFEVNQSGTSKKETRAQILSDAYRVGGTDVALADGGTGASDAATARTNLQLGAAAVADFEDDAGIRAATATNEPVHAAGLRYFAKLYWPIDSRLGGSNFTEITDTHAGSLIKTDRNMTLDNAFDDQQTFMIWNVDTEPHTLTVEAGAGGTGTINSGSSITIGPGGLAIVTIESNAGDEPTGAAFGDLVAPVVLSYAVSDETTALTTGTAKISFRMPFAMYLTAVRASVVTAPTDAALTVDLNEGGTTVLSTKLTIDSGELTSTTAATPAAISDAALADDALMTVDIDQIGSTVAGAGLKVTFYGWRLS